MNKISLLFFSFLILSSCEKDSPIFVDFRDQLIGKYQVKEEKFCYGPCGDCYSLRDTTLSVYYGSTASSIRLSLSDREFQLDENGVYAGQYFNMRLWKDSIYTYTRNGGLGCGCVLINEGYRISKKP
ncbi:MAG: hypothetical protein ACOVP1_04435 [Bacteroidia bacterium]